ncbi:hypothetical protein HYFRA_00008106 [Hymenoscyphus fraxineus]|uniref:Uncharacterized protein n=1 Tax=Hymenoscyphus fraxineus TaxID=746836 RepID=A0A9N9L6K1_9HELO|nr:hypothetical protein HYFRA_00008106 [Hymenoscyphus fraxineus]
MSYVTRELNGTPIVISTLESPLRPSDLTFRFEFVFNLQTFGQLVREVDGFSRARDAFTHVLREFPIPLYEELGVKLTDESTLNALFHELNQLTEPEHGNLTLEEREEVRSTYWVLKRFQRQEVHYLKVSTPTFRVESQPEAGEELQRVLDVLTAGFLLGNSFPRAEVFVGMGVRPRLYAELPLEESLEEEVQ